MLVLSIAVRSQLHVPLSIPIPTTPPPPPPAPQSTPPKQAHAQFIKYVLLPLTSAPIVSVPHGKDNRIKNSQHAACGAILGETFNCKLKITLIDWRNSTKLFAMTYRLVLTFQDKMEYIYRPDIMVDWAYNTKLVSVSSPSKHLWKDMSHVCANNCSVCACVRACVRACARAVHFLPCHRHSARFALQ